MPALVKEADQSGLEVSRITADRPLELERSPGEQQLAIGQQ
jgi:2-succinyl-5-enolpyruvyl-6-hydroxy-3-cyclohexene-1-carboxylate synthase